MTSGQQPARSSARKAQLRETMRSVLRQLSTEARAAASAAVSAALLELPEILAARSVMAYLPLPREVDLLPAALELLRAGKVVAVPEIQPVADGGTGGTGGAGGLEPSMRAVAVESLADDELVAGPMGVRTPRRGRPLRIESLQVILVPGLAFDWNGHRLGRGGGFYDRFLAHRRAATLVVGVCFDAQLVERVPAEPHDAVVDRVLTERRVVYTHRADAANSTMEG